VHFKLTPRCEFLVLACDGMWTRHTEESCVEKVRQGVCVANDHAQCRRRDCVLPEVRAYAAPWLHMRLRASSHHTHPHSLNPTPPQHGWRLSHVAKWTVDDVVHNLQCQDNVTLLLIAFHNAV